MKILNDKLPANIYLPFVNDGIRNYVVVHIPLSELKIYNTKQRSPFSITFELIRADELCSKDVVHLKEAKKSRIMKCNQLKAQDDFGLIVGSTSSLRFDDAIETSKLNRFKYR